MLTGNDNSENRFSLALGAPLVFVLCPTATVSLLVWGDATMKNVLAELGITSGFAQGNLTDKSDNTVQLFPIEEKKDYFVKKNGISYAGTHLLLEMWGAENLDDPELIETALCDSARTAGATILHAHTHHFSPFGGVSGVVVLAESHISIHTWPERGYVALDIFMCGECDPYKAVPVLRQAFTPDSLQISEHKRGLIP